MIHKNFKLILKLPLVQQKKLTLSTAPPILSRKMIIPCCIAIAGKLKKI